MPLFIYFLNIQSHRHCLIPVFTYVTRRKIQTPLITTASTVRPEEDIGYNRVVPGRTESGAFSQ
jgi:hypothetical protein